MAMGHTTQKRDEHLQHSHPSPTRWGTAGATLSRRLWDSMFDVYPLVLLRPVALVAKNYHGRIIVIVLCNFDH